MGRGFTVAFDHGVRVEDLLQPIFEESLNRFRIGLPSRFLHHLSHEKTDQFCFATAESSDLIPKTGQHRVDPCANRIVAAHLQ